MTMCHKTMTMWQ